MLVMDSMGSADVRRGRMERTRREENNMDRGREKGDPSMINNVGQFSAPYLRRSVDTR